MCNPVLAVLAITTAATVYGQQQQARAAQNAANDQAREISTQAGFNQDAANAKADLIRKAGQRQASEARASLSVSGVAVDEGTPLKINEEIQRGSEFDALNAILSGSRNSDSAARQAEIYGKQGVAARKAANVASATSVMQAGASGMTASGWRSNGPGFSGTQSPAPISTIKVNN